MENRMARITILYAFFTHYSIDRIITFFIAYTQSSDRIDFGAKRVTMCVWLWLWLWQCMAMTREKLEQKNEKWTKLIDLPWRQRYSDDMLSAQCRSFSWIFFPFCDLCAVLCHADGKMRTKNWKWKQQRDKKWIEPQVQKKQSM